MCVKNEQKRFGTDQQQDFDADNFYYFFHGLCSCSLLCDGDFKMKKGQHTMTFLVIVIIMVVVIALLAYFVWFGIGGAANEAAWKTTCEGSLEAYRLAGSEIKCPVLDWEIKSDEKEEIEEELAEKMKTCNDLFMNGALFEDGINCVPCYEVYFESEDNWDLEIKVPGLEGKALTGKRAKLLSNDRIPSRVEGTKRYYVLYAEAEETLIKAAGVFLVEKGREDDLCNRFPLGEPE